MPWLDWRAPTRKSLPFLFRSSEGAPRSRHLAGLSCSSFCAQVVGDFDPVARSCKKKAIVDALGLESGATRKGTTSFLFFQGRRCRRQQRENDAGRGGSDEGSLGLLSFLSFPAPSSSSFPLSPLPLTAAPLLLSLISYLSFPLPLSPLSYPPLSVPSGGWLIGSVELFCLSYLWTGRTFSKITRASSDVHDSKFEMMSGTCIRFQFFKNLHSPKTTLFFCLTTIVQFSRQNNSLFKPACNF